MSIADDLQKVLLAAKVTREALRKIEIENADLRAELIKVLRFVGGQATPEVSTQSLLNVGDEVSAVLGNMAAVTADLRAEVQRLRGEVAEMTKHRDDAVDNSNGWRERKTAWKTRAEAAEGRERELQARCPVEAVEAAKVTNADKG